MTGIEQYPTDAELMAREWARQHEKQPAPFPTDEIDRIRTALLKAADVANANAITAKNLARAAEAQAKACNAALFRFDVETQPNITMSPVDTEDDGA
jgi:hypothetical protein